jgi:cation diffusion facilitator family transporter
MASSVDLSNTITMHPHPLHLYPNRSSPSPSKRRENEPDDSAKPSASTAFDAVEVPGGGRHLASRRNNSYGDVERQRSTPYTHDSDPYHLSSSLKTETELSEIRANISHRRDGCGPVGFSKGSRTARKLEGFYESQNERIELLLKPVDNHRAEAKKAAGEDQLQYKIAVYGSFAANVILAGLQIYAAVSSGSLSLITTMADAIFDPMSNVTLIVANRAVNHVDGRRFPSGKARIETAGNITFCFIMSAVGAIIIVLSARELAGGSTGGTTSFHLPSVIAVAVAFVTKFSLWLYCWALKDKYSQINILWQDHRNDLFINGFGILTSVGGSKLRWWIDPMGAIILSTLIDIVWLRTATKEFLLLIGVTADTEIQQLITYIAVTHSSEIEQIDTVRVYHSGPRLIVEVDVVMNQNMTLKATHDVAEALQFKLESLPDVERAYVHVDYETSHKPEHFLKKEL